MYKPIIGIISKPNIFCKDKLFTHQMVYDRIRNAVLENGGLAIAILPTQITSDFCIYDRLSDDTVLSKQEKEDLYNIVNRCDGIILQGGLCSQRYEIEIAKYAIKNDIPILGICAGFNNIIRAMGGNVFELNNTRHNKDDGSIVHKNSIKKGSLLHTIFKTSEIEVNSIHTMFANDDNIKNLDICAYSDDGYVEAVELKNKRFVLGLKWHPELMLDYDKGMNNIFKYFIKVCQK